MLNKFINWKKNIEPVLCYGLELNFDVSQVDLSTLKESILNISSTIADEKLRKLLSEKDMQFEQNSISKKYFVEDINNSINLSRWLRISEINNLTKNQKWIFVSIQSPIPFDQFIEVILRINGMCIATLFNPYFRSWENKNSIKSYKYKGGLNEWFNQDFQMNMVDLSNRPGRITDTEKFRFQGGIKYWFGKEFFKGHTGVSLESLKPIGYIKEIDNDITVLDLGELGNYWDKSIQERISQLRKLLKIDEN